MAGSETTFSVVAAKNYRRKMLPAPFNYVACLPVGRYLLWGKTPGGRKL
jgi:hypothetical protein